MTTTQTAKTPGALDGVKIAAFEQVLSGPFATCTLADMGAEVVKIERPGVGDLIRHWDSAVKVLSSGYVWLNRNKQSLTVDVKKEQGREIIYRLVRESDVFFENYAPGVAERLGFGYAALSEINPRLIYCSISGYGRSGPYADKGGFDLIAQGMSGLMAITGEPDGEPVKAGSPICDINAGILGALGIVSAYVHRLKTGEGQLVDTSLFEAGIQQTYWQSAIFFATGHSPEPSGSAHILSAPYQAFRAKDGWLTIGGANQPNWERLARVLGAPEWVADKRFRANSDRMKNLEALVPLMNAKLGHKTVKEWIALLEIEGVPCGPINSIGDMAADPQTLAREMVVELDHPRAGPTRALGLPIKFSATPGRVARPAPCYGEHTREVLGEFGFTAQEIEALLTGGAAA